MERSKSLKIMNITATSLFALVILLYIAVILFPQGILRAFIGQTEIQISALANVYILMGAIKPLIFAVIGLTGFRRKDMSFKWGMATAVTTGILSIFPPAFLRMYFSNIIVRFTGMEQLAYIAYIAMGNAVAMFSFLSTIGILLIFGSAVAEVYAVKKLQEIKE